ncbi:MAG: hypothetical protein CM15mV56_030 [uncultured marine virus]|nr:MAG: hypothetical protein CM15mV56_030 [uncultured marine virus]
MEHPFWDSKGFKNGYYEDSDPEFADELNIYLTAFKDFPVKERKFTEVNLKRRFDFGKKCFLGV